MFQYCLFDLDGTLTDPREGITKSVAYALKAFGITVESCDELTCFIGPPLLDSFMEFYHFSREDAQKAVQKYRERFAPIGVLENRLFEGVKPMLKELKEKGMKLAIASSKPTVFVEQILDHFGIMEYFDVVVGSELDGSRGTKEEVVAEALLQLGILEAEKEERHRLCVMVGDRKFDVQGAVAYGLTAVGVSFGFAEEGELAEAGAMYIAETVEELHMFLAGHKDNKQ